MHRAQARITKDNKTGRAQFIVPLQLTLIYLTRYTNHELNRLIG